MPGSYMGWGKSTQLGYGLGIIMGAKLAAPEKLCINIMGDAAIGMTGMDIETAARNRIAILTIVFNNGVMGAERDVLEISDEKYGAHDGRRQLHQGGRGPQRRRHADRKAGRHRRRRSSRPWASPNPARRSCWRSWSRKATTSRATSWMDCKADRGELGWEAGSADRCSEHSPS